MPTEVNLTHLAIQLQALAGFIPVPAVVINDDGEVLAHNEASSSNEACVLEPGEHYQSPSSRRRLRSLVEALVESNTIGTAKSLGRMRITMRGEGVEADVRVVGFGHLGVVVCLPVAQASAEELGAIRAFETRVRELIRELSAAGVRPEREPAAALADSSLERLSAREREVLEAFRAAGSVAVVSSTLHLSPHTVRSHLKAIYRKLGVSSQAELLASLMR